MVFFLVACFLLGKGEQKKKLSKLRNNVLGKVKALIRSTRVERNEACECH